MFSAGVLAAAGYELVLASFHFDLREELTAKMQLKLSEEASFTYGKTKRP